MGAVRMKTLADLRRRRLQTLVLTVVLFLAAGAATLAADILFESNAPFARAFAAANGAHLVIEYDGAIDHDRLAATGGAAGVTASAGPWPVTDGGLSHPKGGIVLGAVFSGRPQPDPAIDAVTISSGRWWQAPGEAVLDESTARLLNRRVGDIVRAYSQAAEPARDKIQVGRGAPAGPEPLLGPSLDLTVVGIAASVSTPDVALWASPTDIASLAPGRVPNQQMLYRVTPAASAADLAAAMAQITANVSPSAVTGTQTYLDVKAGVDRLADLYVPILLAFSLFALLAAGFTISNVVSGVVLTSYREIGLMKALGFTPGQVSWILVAQVLAPVVVGSVAGVVVGTIASAPIVAQTARSFGLPATFTPSVPVIATVLGICVTMAVVAAIGPALRAGRLSVVAAIARGTAPSGRPDGGRLRALALRLPISLLARLGVAAGVAHPPRAAMTLGALVVGVTAATFSIGLNASLLRVQDDLSRRDASPVRADVGSRLSPAEVTAAIEHDPDTARFVSVGQTQVTIQRAGAIPFVGYRNASDWLGYRLIEGRWFSGPGEAVAPTNLFTQTGLHVGDTVTIVRDDRPLTIRLVGEIFDAAREGRDNLLLRGTWDDLIALDPAVQVSAWEMHPVEGVEARSYAQALQEDLGMSLPMEVVGDKTEDESFMLFLTVVGLMGVVLVAISLGGVFNTVLLETRQRTHELAVLKAIGLTPAQLIGMVVSSIVPVGVLAGLIGVPIGLAAQRIVLTYMGQVAASTNIPPSTFEVFGPVLIGILALSGLAIGVVGALPPAQRAARARIAPVLQAE